MPTQRSKDLAQKKADGQSRKNRRAGSKGKPKQRGKNKRQ